MQRRVQDGEDGARRVREHIDAFEAEMITERLDVGDLSIAAVRGRVGRNLGVTGAPQAEHDQPATRRLPAEIAEAGGGPHATAGRAEE